ncbi:transmembrane protein, putative (macronuclear) [Tetrahymena thermophila SB210]|uniref:Transmembrane protein, putative n=1 Tax=Tetrahymena thermophila (strain SB210) TaxID=312017 RepID=W7X3N0_TETTS|nr:transmembrane protein, putative [Tetrahymena thermophila SB210]EWS71028.1 transmembrane protein, putative [Tetrahymena thermophila SB210]|eukprot:XP_012656436.1 transmembrane protein, putative [Tetrahymena thermophila SB210]
MSLQKTVLSLILVALSVSVLLFVVQKSTNIQRELKQYQSFSEYLPTNQQCLSDQKLCGDSAWDTSLPCCAGLVCKRIQWDTYCVSSSVDN